MEIFLGAAIGGLVGFLLAVPAMVAESSRRVKNLPVLIDIKEIFGKKLTHEELFAISLLFHLVIATLVGGIYTLFAEQGWLFFTNAPYALHSILIFSVFAWVFNGALICPAMRLGFFGRHEGPHIWFELIVLHQLIGLGLWIGFSYYQSFFFG
ncbi:MAG: hypothetical protein AAB337_02935 [Patescibacteria group bacterium]